MFEELESALSECFQYTGRLLYVYVVLVDGIVLFMELKSALSECFWYTCRLLYVVLVDYCILFYCLWS